MLVMLMGTTEAMERMLMVIIEIPLLTTLILLPTTAIRPLITPETILHTVGV